MKKNALFFVFITLFISCSNDLLQIVEESSGNSLKDSLQIAKNKLYSLGFDTCDVIALNDQYIVEGDIIIYKDVLFTSNYTRQYHVTNTVNNNQTITIGLNNVGMVPYWAYTLAQASIIYNNYTGLDVQFNGVDSNADIVVSEFTNDCGLADFPLGNGKPGKNVYVYNFYNTNCDTNTKIHLLMHEIGHALGLRHSNCMDNGEGDGGMGRVWIPGTPTYDGNSYMKSGTCYYSWTSMPHYDEIALKYLFPILNYTIHFENSTLNDLVVPSSSTGYYLDRRIFPKMNGYSFRGWRHDPTLFAEYDYSTPIKNKFKTLYAKWEPIGNLHSSTCTSYEGQSSILFTLPYTSVVIITSTVFRGMNSWNDLKTHNDTYTKIENTGYSQQYSLTNYMNGLSTEPSIVHTDTLVLSSGSYTLTSSLTTALGQQNVSNGNHGSVLIKVDYY